MFVFTLILNPNYNDHSTRLHSLYESRLCQPVLYLLTKLECLAHRRCSTHMSLISVWDNNKYHRDCHVPRVWSAESREVHPTVMISLCFHSSRCSGWILCSIMLWPSLFIFPLPIIHGFSTHNFGVSGSQLLSLYILCTRTCLRIILKGQEWGQMNFSTKWLKPNSSSLYFSIR